MTETTRAIAAALDGLTQTRDSVDQRAQLFPFGTEPEAEDKKQLTEAAEELSNAVLLVRGALQRLVGRIR